MDQNYLKTSSSNFTSMNSNMIFKNHLPQQFSIPRSIVYYITKEPSSQKGFQKLFQTCKYFFSQNPIIFVECLNFKKYYTKLTCREESYNILLEKSNNKILHGRRKQATILRVSNVNQIACKFWISEFVCFSDLSDLDINILSQKIAFFDYLFFSLSTFVLNKLSFLTNEIRNLHLRESSPLNEDGTPMSIEEIFAIFPNLENFVCDNNLRPLKITSESVKTIINSIKKLKRFYLVKIPEIFDFLSFAEIMKAQPQTDFHLTFGDNLSIEYKNQLQEFIDETIKSSKSFDFLPPLIWFRGSKNSERLDKLYRKVERRRRKAERLSKRSRKAYYKIRIFWPDFVSSKEF